MKFELTTAAAKDQATKLATYLAGIKRKVSRGNALEAIAQMYGAKSWNVLSSQLDNAPAEASAVPAPAVPVQFFVRKDGERVQLTVSAEAHSDDHRKQVDFDAAAWFVQATDEEIIDLKNCDWGGDYPADHVAEYLSSKRLDEELVSLFAYLDGANEHLSMFEDTIGFEVHVEETPALQYCRAFRYPLFVKLVLLSQFEELGPDGSDTFVQEDASQPGKWTCTLDGEASEVRYDSEDAAYKALGEYLENRDFKEWLASDVLLVEPGSGELLGQVPTATVMPLVPVGDDLIAGRSSPYVGEPSKVLVMKPGDKPLSVEALRHITEDGEYYLTVAVSVSMDELISGDIEALNDLVDEKIVSEGLLMDLTYERYTPENEAALHDTKDNVYILVNAGWDPCGSFDDEDDEDAEGDE